jgi:hypothetical protein
VEAAELFYPQIMAHAGLYSFDKGIKIEIHSSQESLYDWGKICFTEQFQPTLALSRKDPASIELGYNEMYDVVFSGYVAQPYNSGSLANEIILKDDMVLLETTKINDTFRDTTPQEMISYFLSQAGITESKLSPQVFPERKQVPIRQMSAIQAINAVHAAWGIKQKFFFSGGVFYWGEKPDQDKIYSFEYGVNILNLIRTGGVWELETVSAPFVKHSHKIAVTHPKLSGTFEVSKVVFITNDEGFIRTFINFN